MKYDFTTLMDRRGRDAIAVDMEEALRSGMLGIRDVKLRDGFPSFPCGLRI